MTAAPTVSQPTVHAPRSPADVAFGFAFAGHVAFAVLWLASGLGPSLASRTWPAAAVVLDYAFSVVNLSLGVFLVVRRGDDPVARLLAIGTVGAAAAFNLQSHVRLDVPGTVVQQLHIALHHVAAGVAYVLALLWLGPGRSQTRRAPRIVWIGVAVCSAVVFWRAVGLGTAGFVVLFGLLIPAVGAIAQVRALASDAEAEARRRARFVVLALLPALVTGVLLVAWLALSGTLAAPSAVKGVVFRVLAVPFAFVPAALFVGISRHRILDIDLVASRAIAYGGLVGAITATYTALVVLVGAAAGAGRGAPVPLLIAATVAAAGVSMPLRSRLERLANRLVYGPRARPYEVLARLAGRVGSAPSVDDVLPAVAAATADSLGASSVRVVLRLPDGSSVDAVAPSAAPDDEPMATVELTASGRVIGELSVPEASLNAAGPEVSEAVAASAATALEGVMLAHQLRGLLRQLSEQTTQLENSRARLLAARDDERRRLSGQLSEQVSSRLAEVAARAARGREVAGYAPAQAARELGEAASSVQGALEALRGLARETFPHLLTDGGLPAALPAESRRGAGFSVQVDPGCAAADEVSQAAVYFCCLRAARDGAHDGTVHVAVTCAGDMLEFTVTTTGRSGIDESELLLMEDHVASAGGWLDFRRSDDSTVVTGGVPALAGRSPTTPSPGSPAPASTSE